MTALWGDHIQLGHVSGEYPILWSEGARGDLWVGSLSVTPGSVRLSGGNASENTSRELLRDNLATIGYAEVDEQLVRTKTLRLELKAGGILLITTLAGLDVLDRLFKLLA